MEPPNSNQPKPEVDPFLILMPFPMISRMILAPLSVPDLLRCSEVSRVWHQAAAATLLKRKVSAYISVKCTNICKLNAQLPPPQHCLINSLTIHIPREHSSCGDCTFHHWKRACTINLNGLRLRSFDLHVYSCLTTMQLMRELLYGARNSLEELILTYHHDRHPLHYVMPREDVIFPTLKTVQVKEPSIGWPEDVFEIIRAAPNLSSVHGYCWLNEAQYNECLRLDVFTSLNVFPFLKVEEALDLLSQSRSNLSAMKIVLTDTAMLSLSWPADLLHLLQHSRFTLQKLSICATEFLKIQRESPVLQVLNCLELFFPEEVANDAFASTVAMLNLDGVCPCLSTLQFTWSNEYFTQETHFCLPELSISSVACHSVQEFTTKNANCVVATVEACILSFPKISAFGFEMMECVEYCIDTDDEHIFNVYKIWTEIVTLEKLKVRLVSPQISAPCFALDALFCGMSTDEVDDLTEAWDPTRYRENEENWDGFDPKRFQYCCVRPSLLYAKGLKEVSLSIPKSYKHTQRCIPEVSRHLVFARKPGLHLSIRTCCPSISAEILDWEEISEMKLATEKDEEW